MRVTKSSTEKPLPAVPAGAAADPVRHEGAFRSMVENSPDLIARFDREFRHVYANPAAARITGIPVRRLLGRTNRELGLGNGRVADWEQAVQQVFMTGSEGEAEISYPSAGGERYFHARLVPELAADGTVASVLGFTREVTAQERAEQALRGAEERANRVAERMRAVAGAAAGVVGAPSLETLLEVVRGACRRVVPFDAFTFSLYDAATDTLQFLESYERGVAVGDDGTLPLAGTPSEAVVRERRSRVTSTSADPLGAGAQPFGSMRRSESVIRTPIVAGEQVLGVLSAQSYTPNLYGECDVEVMDALAALAATAILNLRFLADRKAAEEQVRRSERYFRALIEQGDDVITVLDADGTVWYQSPSYERVLGWTLEERFGHGAFELLHPDDVEPMQRILGQLLQAPGLSRRVECRVRDSRGRWRTLESVARNMLHDPEVGGVVITSRDVTDRREAEEALRRSEERLEVFLRQTPAVFWATDPELRVTLNRGAALTRLGHRDDAMAGMSMYEVFGTASEEHPGIAAHSRALAGESASYELDWAGSPFQSHVEPFRDTDGAIRGVIGIAMDIAERKRAEEVLRRQALLFDSLLDAVLIEDADGRITDWNPAAERIFGYTRAEALGQSPNLIHHPAHHGRLEREILETARREGQWRGEIRFLRKDGTEGIADGVVVAEYDPQGRPIAFMSVSRDVTERRRAQERIHYQAKLLDTVGQAVIATDLEGQVLYWNQAAETIYGWSMEEALGRSILELIPAHASREQAAEILECLRAGEVWSGEFLVNRRDGTSFPAHVTDTPIHNEAGEMIGMVGISSDVSARRHLEVQLAQAQKMEAIGRLAGGVAHDFNNLLTAIGGSASFLLSDLGPQHPSRVDAESIHRAALRAGALTRQLLAFSRKQVLQPRVVELNGQLAEMLKMASRIIGEDVRLVTVASERPAPVKVDPVQLEQVVLNLCINARDAMPRGGALTLEVAHREVSADQAGTDRFAIPPGAYVQLSVRDTGHGMEDEVLSHIFEPFFTTKEQGKGTGLGLSTVYGIVTQSGGHLDVRSVVGEGTVFDILLPLVEDEPIDATYSETHEDGPRGTGTILLVEDEEIVRSNTRRMLEQGGYTVLEAADGEEALRIFSACPVPIDLLLTDVVMPGINGPDLADRLKELSSNLLVMFMSGYSDERILHHGIRESDEVLLIEKPFQPAGLLRAVREALA